MSEIEPFLSSAGFVNIDFVSKIRDRLGTSWMFRAPRSDHETYLQLLYDESFDQAGKFLVCELVARDRRGFHHTRLKNELRVPLRLATVVDLTEDKPDESGQIGDTHMEDDDENKGEEVTEATKRPAVAGVGTTVRPEAPKSASLGGKTKAATPKPASVSSGSVKKRTISKAVVKPLVKSRRSKAASSSNVKQLSKVDMRECKKAGLDEHPILVGKRKPKDTWTCKFCLMQFHASHGKLTLAQLTLPAGIQTKGKNVEPSANTWSRFQLPIRILCFKEIGCARFVTWPFLIYLRRLKTRRSSCIRVLTTHDGRLWLAGSLH